MTTSSSLKALGLHLDEAYSLLPDYPPATPEEGLDLYTSVAIAILDASHADCLEHYGEAPGLLQEYLETKLYLFNLENGLTPIVNPREE